MADVKASGDPVRLQNLVDAKLITEDEALGLIDPTKASAATGAPAAPQAAPATPQARVTPEQLEAANRRIQERIDALRASGDQGGILARAVEQAVRRRGISVEQAVTIFDTADVLNEILPQRSRDRIRFVQQLMDRGGAAEGSGGEAGGQVAGLNTSRTQDVTNGIIELSLALSRKRSAPRQRTKRSTPFKITLPHTTKARRKSSTHSLANPASRLSTTAAVQPSSSGV